MDGTRPIGSLAGVAQQPEGTTIIFVAKLDGSGDVPAGGGATTLIDGKGEILRQCDVVERRWKQKNRLQKCEERNEPGSHFGLVTVIGSALGGGVQSGETVTSRRVEQCQRCH